MYADSDLQGAEPAYAPKLMRISVNTATRDSDFQLRMHQNRLSVRLRSDPLGSSQRSPMLPKSPSWIEESLGDVYRERRKDIVEGSKEEGVGKAKEREGM